MKRFITTAITLVLLASSALAQDNGGSPPNVSAMKYKDPGTATLISVAIPGGGHIYAGEIGKGLGLLGVSIGAPVLGIALSTFSTISSCNLYDCEYNGSNLAPMYLGVAVSLGAWIYGIIDAGDAARRTNRQNGLASSSQIKVNPKVAIHGGETSYGIQVSIGL